VSAATLASTDRRTAGPAHRLGPRSRLVLAVASAAGLLMFVWPLLLRPDPAALEAGGEVTPPFVFLLLLPVVVLVVVAELTEDGMDSKALAMLGVLTAINAALRPLGGGLAGVELVFFMLVLAGRVFGAGFGFVLGCTSLFASALLTSGVGPWLPYQMLASAWIGLGAGLLPRRLLGRDLTGRTETALLAVYGILCAYGFGILMNLSTWPYVLGVAVPGHEGTLAYVAGAPLAENLHRFLLYTLLTSTGGWDTGRAITNTLALVVLGPAVMATLRRAARRAAYLPAETPPHAPAPTSR
jgi:energy-coupling factor transport system substrate-specific component